LSPTKPQVEEEKKMPEGAVEMEYGVTNNGFAMLRSVTYCSPKPQNPVWNKYYRMEGRIINLKTG